MKKPLERILNYFTGRDILNYYSDLEKKSPEFYKEVKLGKQKIQNLLLGSIIPNIIDIGAVVYTGFTKDYFGGSFALGASEGFRSHFRYKFQYPQQSNNAYKEHAFVCEKSKKNMRRNKCCFRQSK